LPSRQQRQPLVGEFGADAAPTVPWATALACATSRNKKGMSNTPRAGTTDLTTPPEINHRQGRQAPSGPPRGCVSLPTRRCRAIDDDPLTSIASSRAKLVRPELLAAIHLGV